MVLAEWETRDGLLIALGNKLYQCYDVETNDTKKGTKGSAITYNSLFRVT